MSKIESVVHKYIVDEEGTCVRYEIGRYNAAADCVWIRQSPPPDRPPKMTTQESGERVVGVSNIYLGPRRKKLLTLGRRLGLHLAPARLFGHRVALGGGVVLLLDALPLCLRLLVYFAAAHGGVLCEMHRLELARARVTSEMGPGVRGFLASGCFQFFSVHPPPVHGRAVDPGVCLWRRWRFRAEHRIVIANTVACPYLHSS